MLPFRSRRFENWSVSICILSILLAGSGSVIAQEKTKRKQGAKARASATPGAASLANIPLVVGHEAKGLVLPDFDLAGKQRGRFEAGTARRIDEAHVGFTDLKITTFTPENTVDLTIEMSDSVLDLNTRVLRSDVRTMIRRTDFEISGDSMEFNTQTRKGALGGNVKMVIRDSSKYVKKEE